MRTGIHQSFRVLGNALIFTQMMENVAVSCFVSRSQSNYSFVCSRKLILAIYGLLPPAWVMRISPVSILLPE